MDEEAYFGIKLKDWAWLAGGLITLISLIKGLVEFKKNNQVKRAEFLEKLILEFNDQKMFLAKRILDDFWIDLEAETGTSDTDLVKIGSLEAKDENQLKMLVKDLLRHHSERSVINDNEHRARQSFDDLLDFFTKLDYYLTLKLISKKELTYFIYYFERCARKADGAVLAYAAKYGFPSVFRLIYVLNIQHKNKKMFEENLEFTDASQESYYDDLRNNFLLFS